MRDLISKGLLTAAAATSVLSLGGGYALAVDSDGVAAESPGLLSGNTIQAPVEIPVNICGNTVDAVGAGNPAFGNSCANTPGVPDQAAHRDADHGKGGRTDDSSTSTRPAHHQQDDDRTPPGAGHHGDHGRPSMSDLAADPYDEAMSGSYAHGTAEGSPGVLSGNLLQAPLDIPLNVCGNSVDVVGLLNPASGKHCSSGPEALPEPERHHPRPETPEHPEHPGTPETHEPPTSDRTVPPHPVPEKPATPKPMTPVVTPPRAVTPPETPQLAETGSGSHLLAAAGTSAALLLGGGILYRRKPTGARV